MNAWKIERVIHFGPNDLCKDGFVHFGFHDRAGRQYALEHRKHFIGLVGGNDTLKWTVAADKVFADVPNIYADIKYPMYIDGLPDGTLVVSNFGNARLYRIDVRRMEARLFVDGSKLGMRDIGNCVVDNEGCVWVNEVEGCRMWRFNYEGRTLLTLGDGTPGFQSDNTDFSEVRFNWIYDIRRGPEGNIYVLDSRNFAVRMIDLGLHRVRTIAGMGKAGYEGDGGDARFATFGSEPAARFDGPISLSLDEEGDIYVGDRYNHVVRMVHRKTGVITTIAGNYDATDGERNSPKESNPLRLNLPQISSMDYWNGYLFIPTDITEDSGDLIVLRKA
jgi:hypothetical protein